MIPESMRSRAGKPGGLASGPCDECASQGEGISPVG